MAPGTTDCDDLMGTDEFAAFSTEVRGLASTLPGVVDRDAGAVLDEAIAESAQTLRLLNRHGIDPSMRMMEIGSGLGLTSVFLARLGYDITSVEPAAVGYNWHKRMAESLYAELGAGHPHFPVTADQVPASAGPFDLIFSNNVVEHIADPIMTLTRLASLLAPEGKMVHSCPNYAVPYEPHFGLPLLPIRPSATAHILPRRIGRSELWRSLNFVRAGDIRRWAASNRLQVEFARGQLADSIERLTVDTQFAARHRALSRIAGVLVASRITRLLRRLPAGASTPMEFSVSR